MITAFLCFLLGFTLIGLSSIRKSSGSKQDYYLASSSISSWLVGLSAVATNNSGYMFIGVIGYTYVTGLASIWLMFGWIAGDFIASLFVHSRLRNATDQSNEISYAGVLSHWHGKDHNTLQAIIGGISLLFLLVYASAQLVAGSKALHVIFDWPIWAGAVMSAVLVALYCFAGGIRASIWTDAAQSIVMMLAMSILLFVTIQNLGGIDQTLNKMHAVDGFMDWFPKDLILPGLTGGALFMTGWMFAGLSVIGQPHIMVRFMALESTEKMKQARYWYYLWFLIFYSLATCVGLLSRVYLADTANFDAELALPIMAQQLLPPALTGLILAGIFAATMSTADSLILGCSAAVTHDLLPHRIEKTALIKLITVIITGCALILALLNNQSVFNLVIIAWSGLASAFSPLLIVLCLGKKPDQTLSIIAVFTGFFIALGWRYMGWHHSIYEGMAGILCGLLLLSMPLSSQKN